MLTWVLNFGAPTVAHDIHVSNTQITKNEDGKIEVVVRIFYDDLQMAMGLLPGHPLPAKYRSADALIEKYLNDKMRWFFDGKKVSPVYVKSKAASPAVWAYLYLDAPVNQVKELRLENQLLSDRFDDQVNMVHAVIDSMEYNFVMDKKNWFVSFGFKAH
jgi:hypothetical protein